MALPMPMHEDHQVLMKDYCSGYMDSFGKWSNGFPCPGGMGEQEPTYCCGTDSFKYCCTGRELNAQEQIPQLPLILGVVFGVAVAVMVIVVVSCFHCSCCLLYKKRQPGTGGPLYQMHCSSTNSGVANMYSFSGTTTPADTPRSLSSASSRSHGTIDSTGLAQDRHGLLEVEESRPTVHSFTVDRRLHAPRGARPGSSNLSNRSSMASEDGLEAPPPYHAPHSTLVAVRTSSAAFALSQPHRPHSNQPPYVISSGDSGYSSSLGTFPQTFLSPASPARPVQAGIPHRMNPSFTPALTPTTRPCSTAHIINTHHPHEDQLYTATKF